MSGEHSRRSFLGWISRPETLVGLSALLLSLCGLFISIYEASLIRREQRASVWPNIETAASIRGDEIEIWVRNTGLGPARIDAAALSYDGELLEGWADLVRRLEADATGLASSHSFIGGRVLPVESEREVIFRVYRTDGSEGDFLVRLRDAILNGAVDVSVCYCSVYDECRLSSLRDLVHRSRGVDPGPDVTVNHYRGRARSRI